jgi:hypothetical protein
MHGDYQGKAKSPEEAKGDEDEDFKDEAPSHQVYVATAREKTSFATRRWLMTPFSESSKSAFGFITDILLLSR